jgi:phospholipase C
MNRRDFLTLMAAISSGFVLNRALPLRGADHFALTNPGSSGVDHVVLVMMENRSFDHLIGWLPAANGRQVGLVYNDPAGVAHGNRTRTHHSKLKREYFRNSSQ